MRVLILLLASGLVSANLMYSTGQEHVYKYSGKILTGIPDIDSHFSGLTITCDVLIHGIDRTTFKLGLKNVQFSKFDQRLEGPEPKNWRSLITPTPGPVDASLVQILESPVLFTMMKGKITTLQISSTEPEWTVNIKKALLSLLKIQMPVGQLDIHQNHIDNSVSTLPSYFQVMEEGVDGVCENTYVVTELPTYLVKDPASGIMDLFKPELCAGKKIFQITRTRDMSKCEKLNMHMSSHVVPKEILSRSSLTKFVGCGVSTSSIQLHGVINEAEVAQSLLSFNTELMVTGTMQVLKLSEVKSVVTPLPEISDPRTINNVLYTFPLITDSFSQLSIATVLAKSTSTPVRSIRTPEIISQNPELSTEMIKTDIISKLTSIATRLSEVEHLQKKQITSKLMSVAHVFSMLTTHDMKSLHTTIMSSELDNLVKKTVLDLFIDVATMTGTTHSALFLKHIVETEQVSTPKALLTIISLGHYVRTPTVELLNHIFAMVKSPVVLKNKVIRNNALINFANLLNKACLSSSKEIRFPVHIFGEFCSSMTSEIGTTYIPYLVNELKTTNDLEYKETLIISLGTIGHESVIPLLLPIIQGKVAGHMTPMRLLSIYSLSGVTEKYSSTLLPVYSTILENPIENRNIRIAALSMMLRTKPNLVMMQKLAILTWHEKDPEMNKYIISTLKSLCDIKVEDLTSQHSLMDLSVMAKTVLPLAKPMPGMLFSNSNIYAAEMLKDLDVGYESQTAFTSSPLGHVLYQKLVYIFQQVKVPVLELAFNMEGGKTLADKISQTFAEILSGDSASLSPLDAVHSEWRKVVQDMRIKSREDVPLHTSIFFNFADDIMASFGIHQAGIDSLMQQIKTSLRNPSSLLTSICGKKTFNINKALNLMPTEIMVATEMGLPLILEAHMPQVISLQGDITVNCLSSTPGIETSLKTKLIGGLYGYVGTISPFTKELVMTGIDEHRSLNQPIKTILKIEPTTGKIIMNILPVVTPTTKTVDVMYYHVKPFTCIRSIIDFVPLTLHPSLKTIHSKTMPTKIVKKFGQTLGVDMTYLLETESELVDLKAVTDKLNLYKNNPVNMLLFLFTDTAWKLNGMPSSRLHKFTIMFEPMTSTTTEAQIDMTLSVASMIQNQNPVQHRIRSGPKVAHVHSEPLIPSSDLQSKLDTILKKMSTHTSYALTTRFNVVLKGSSPMSYTIAMTAGIGEDKTNQKWSLNLEQIPSSLGVVNICVDGSLTMPLIPVWSTTTLQSMPISFSYHNKIGFGSTCSQYTIDIVGSTSVSESQKQISKQSKEAAMCQSNHLSQNDMTRHTACHQQKDQAATLDEVVFTITTNELPSSLTSYGQTMENYLKVLLWKYAAISPVDKALHPDGNIMIKLHFDTILNTISMTVTTPTEILLFKNIRLPEKLQGILPLIAGKETLDQVHQSATGSPLRPTCHLSEGQIHTYDHHSYTYQLDDCYHVVSSDCSSKFSSAVLAKVVSGMKHVKVYHLNTEIRMMPAPTYSAMTKEYVVMVNGNIVSVARNEKESVYSNDHISLFSISRSMDDVITLETPDSLVHYDGMKLEVQSKLLITTGQLCGLCGDSNKDSRADLATPSSCIYKSDHLAALSYRHQTSQCSALPKTQLDLMAVEEEQCLRYKTEQAHPSIQMSPMSLGWLMKHAIMEKEGKTCISKVPVSSCQPGYVAQSNIQKSVNFTCLSTSNKVVKLYVDKVERGDILPELKSLETHYTVSLQMPLSCSRPGH